MRLTSRYRFSAAHRLNTPALTTEENRNLYGKCNNPYGHGHDYILDVTLEGPVDPDGQIVNRATLDELVRRTVISRLDHKYLNADVTEFANMVPTTENLVSAIQAALERNWTLPARLAHLRIVETGRNTFELEVPVR
jgi:6-pyruvoyltetrahydropterin/6-carboxytetrahydropterin synthase